MASGTAIVGDISNTLVAFEPLARSRLAGVVFYELIRFNAPDPEGFVDAAWREIEALEPTERVRVSLAAHAPYSVAPLVFRAIRKAVDRDPFAPCSVHLSESADEVEFIRTGGGPWRQLLEEIGAWDPRWVAPGVSPVQFLDDSGFLDDRVLAVHGVQMTAAGSRAARGAGDHAGHLPAQQRPHRRGRAADRGVLPIGRPRRDRHRQPRQLAGSERLRRAGDDAGAGAWRAGVQAAGERDARRGPGARLRCRLRHASSPGSWRGS